ncbi:MAG: hypothetical protein RLZZ370_1537 [Bacteroidota bacterium]|jgi:hypothetical protein
MLFRCLVFAALWTSVPACAQPAVPKTDSLGGGHFRGLFPVRERVVWLSGSKGSIFRSNNAGKTWVNCSPENHANRDFRDIHAWSRRRAVAMSSGDSAVIISTRNGGKSWNTVYENNTPGIFLDGMDFKGKSGACLGDPMPIHNDTASLRFLMLISDDAGRSWKEFWPNLPVLNGEAAFAASGTSLAYRLEENNEVIHWVSGGGAVPRFFTLTRRGKDVLLSDSTNIRPMPMKGGAGWGAYTMTWSGPCGIVLGGHYRYFRQGDSTAVWRNPHNGQFEPADTFPNGYRSGSCFDPKTRYFYCTGTNGTNISRSYGRSWESFSSAGANAVAVCGRYLWLAGNRGRIQRFTLR